MNNEEVKIRFEGKVEFLNESKDYLLTVTDTSLIFKEIKDLMNKDYKIVKEIIIKDIKNIFIQEMKYSVLFVCLMKKQVEF